MVIDIKKQRRGENEIAFHATFGYVILLYNVNNRLRCCIYRYYTTKHLEFGENFNKV